MAAVIVTFEHYKNNRDLPLTFSETQQRKFRNIRDITQGYFLLGKKMKITLFNC